MNNDLKTQQAANRAVLAAYLMNFPRPARCFSMLNYEVEAECGTICCAAGHGPYAGLPMTEEERNESDKAGWAAYCERTFGATGDIWSWLFCAYWASTRFFTPRDAAIRLMYLNAHDNPPTCFHHTSANGYEPGMRVALEWYERETDADYAD